MALTKVSKHVINFGLGTEWFSGIKTSDFTAEAGKGYFVDTTAGSVTVTLPSGVSGDEIVFQDYTGTFATNSLLLSANGSEKIQGGASNKECIVNNSTVRLIYQDATEGWTGNNISQIPFNISYLVVAGGGGSAGGHQSGGGGAGGYRNSYASETSGGGGSTETPLGINTGTNYTVTVGSGGAGGPAIQAVYQGNTYKGSNGSNSVFATIISVGGGGGASYYHQPNPNNRGLIGGSGGGCGAYTGNTSGAAGTANQGYAGGSNNGYDVPYAGSGGGGAGGAGSDTGPSGAKGHGGVGLSSSITGSAVFRGGGGGGAPWDTTNVGTTNVGLGGNGGGGDSDTRYTAGQAQSGTANTGGGGGGVAQNNTAGASGGSGVVILRYPNTKTITIGSGLTGSTATVGNDKVTTFTAGTGTISFT